MSPNPTDPLAPLERGIVDHFFTARPTVAAGLGLHEYDGRLPDLSSAATARWATEAQRWIERLEATAESDLSPARRFDRGLLRLLLEGALFDLEEVRDLDRNPMSVLFQPDLTNYLARDYAPAATRIAAIARLLAGVPQLLESAKRRLEPRLPRPFVTLAIQIASGLPSHFAEGDALATSVPGEVRGQLRTARESADAAVLAFADWLRTERLPRADGSFPLGRERFQRLLWVREGLSTPVEEVLRRGEADLARNHARLDEIARREGLPVEQRIARLNDRHPAPAELLPLVRRLTDEIREFVRAQDLVTIPGAEACHVRETPPWARDLWTAAMSPPGPFERPVDGVYWVTAIDPAWTPAQQESWLRTLNYSMLRNTTVHEVWPGHYLQALHQRAADLSLARKVWFSYSFCEGWAHYCEQVALEAGFEHRSPDAEVAQLTDALMRDCRLIASIGLHTQGMTVDQATELFRTRAHLEPLHAEREAIRGTYNPEYFCYTLGKLAILDAREKYLATRFGSSLRSFHDALLGYGTPPIGFLETLLGTA